MRVVVTRERLIGPRVFRGALLGSFVHILLCLLLVRLLSVSFAVVAAEVPSSRRSLNAIAHVEPALRSELAAKGLAFGAPIYIRVFKQTAELELWVESQAPEQAAQVFSLYKTYRICYFSGRLGPKQRQGDGQSPEGFYFVGAANMNPWSRFHLSFNLGYPNAYDRYHKRTGSALMIHGDCVSIGCYAMTDAGINEIYAMADAALRNGQAFFRVHVFPFRLTDQKLASMRGHQWYGFWGNLKKGYDYFEDHKRPPNVEVVNGRYAFE